MGDYWDTLTSTADDVAGSSDEHVGRTFDDQAGGGFGDLGANYDAVARAGDRGVGYFDEGVGGLAKGVGGLSSLADGKEGNTAGSGTSSMWTPTEENLRETYDDAANAADAATPAWFEWVLNNQEAVAVGVVLLLFVKASDGTVGVSSG